MKLIVGLGNPGPSYQSTRHNAGFLAVDRLVRRHAPGAPLRKRFASELAEGSIGEERCLFLKPQGYMNRSGDAVGEALNFYKLSAASDLLVLVDDYALPIGALRLRASGSPGGHNGLADVERALGTPEYPRCRIGIGPIPPEFNDPADYVLGRFTEEQAKALGPALDRAGEATEAFVTRGIAFAMNRFNASEPARPKPERKPAPASGAPAPGAPASGAQAPGTPAGDGARATSGAADSGPLPKSKQNPHSVG